MYPTSMHISPRQLLWRYLASVVVVVVVVLQYYYYYYYYYLASPARRTI